MVWIYHHELLPPTKRQVTTPINWEQGWDPELPTKCERFTNDNFCGGKSRFYVFGCCCSPKNKNVSDGP